jgi:Tol biopolymer transport system component
MNSDGSGVPLLLTTSVAADFDPAWSPDGEQIAFEIEEGGDFNVVIMGADGLAEHPLTSSSKFDGFPNFSPGGKKITFESDRDGNFNIYKMHLDGTGQRRLTRNKAGNAADDFFPDWGVATQ